MVLNPIGNTLSGRCVLVAFWLIILALGGCGRTYQMGPSCMEPTIKTNELIYVDWHAYKRAAPQRWDVIFTFGREVADQWHQHALAHTPPTGHKDG